jgi:hypothetical protein
MFAFEQAMRRGMAGQQSKGQAVLRERNMKTSREPLHPMRNWRELWHAEGLPHDPLLRERATLRASQNQQTKRPAFHWFNQLLNRDAD